MSRLDLQVRRARRRLILQRMVISLCWSCSITLAAAAGVVLAGKWWPIPGSTWQWCGGALALGTLAAVVWTWLRSPSVLDAAEEIDRRYGLEERVASAVALEPATLNSPAGQALVADAARRVDRLALGEQFRLSIGAVAWAPVASAVLVVLLALLIGPQVSNQAEAKLATQVEKEQVQKSSETLRKQLEQRKEQAEKKGMKDAEDLFNKLERGTRELSEAGESDRKQALVKLNDLAKELDQRRQALGSAEKMKQQLEQLKQIEKGPADRMVDAMQQGDMKKAVNELDQLRDKLAKGELDQPQQEQLTKQLEQMQQKLQAAADAQKKAVDELQKQIEQAKAGGQQQQADQLQQQLDQLQQKMPAPEQLKDMANQLGKAAQAAKNNQGQQAAKDLEGLKEQLAGMQEQLEEAEMLDAARDQIADAKQGMNCKECQGGGCAECQGNGAGGKRGAQQAKGAGDGRQRGQGNGIGQGKGGGFEDRDPLEASTYDTRVPQKVGKGSAVVTGFVDGPNAKGQVQAKVKTEWEAVKGQQSDPVADQPLPRGYKEHAKGYFDSLRTGK